MQRASSPDAKARFSNRVDAYVAARPRYPEAVIDLLGEKIGLVPSWQVVDVGSGTGISCELFLRSGHAVTAIEPNDAMRAAAEKLLGGFAGFRSLNGAAEATTLPARYADLVVAAQAFHWFDIPSARREFQRILRSPGYALLMWNDRRLTGAPFLEAYEKLLVAHGTDYLKIRHNNVGAEHFAEFFGRSGYQSASLPNHQLLGLAALRSRLLSSSYVPQEDDPRAKPMLAALREIFEQHKQSGRVTIEYDTRLYFGKLA